MADETEQNDKTEDPTPRKLEESKKKGQVATSREVNHWFLVLAGTIATLMFAPQAMRDLRDALGVYIVHAGTLAADANGLNELLATTLGDVAVAIMPVLMLLVVAALAAGLIQNGLIISVEPIIPKLEKLSLMKGLKRLFSLRALVEFAKGLLKIAIVGTVIILVLVPKFDEIAISIYLPVTESLVLLGDLAVRMMISVVAVMTVITVVDVLYQRFEHMKSQRMSRQEVKEEMKQTEGDPHVKGRLRQLRAERSRQRMMAKVPEADVVITNPTHFAVALKWDDATMTAPTLLAKGVDEVAGRIRRVAEENDIPVVENPPLARALHAGVELDEEVPPEQYRAVAEVISYVFGLKNGGRRR